MLRVDECRLSAQLLHLGCDMERNGRLTGGFRPEDLYDPAARHAPDAEREIKRQRSCRNRLYVHMRVFAELHDRSLAEILFDLGKRRCERFFLVLGGNRRYDRAFFLFICHIPVPILSQCVQISSSDASISSCLSVMISSPVCSASPTAASIFDASSSSDFTAAKLMICASAASLMMITPAVLFPS